METAPQYMAETVRPRLTVVKDGAASYSALPHSVMRNTDLSRDARLLYAILQGHWWQGAESYASHAEMAAEMDCSLSGIRRYLNELMDAGLIAERLAGPRRTKVYVRLPIPQKDGIDSPANASPVADSEPSNTSKPAVQYVKNDASNTSKTTYSYKKTPEKKKPEKKKNTAPTEPAPTRSGALIDQLKASGIGVTMLPQDHKALKDSGADPSLVAEAYGALFRGDWGDDFMRRSISVRFVISRLGAYEAWRRDGAPSVPHVNGTGSKVTPPTDADREIWAKALADLSGLMSAGNFETYFQPLEVGGRNESGGLCLIVPSSMTTGDMLRNHTPMIRRALVDAGDPAPTAVAFKARRSRGDSHAE